MSCVNIGFYLNSREILRELALKQDSKDLKKIIIHTKLKMLFTLMSLQTCDFLVTKQVCLLLYGDTQMPQTKNDNINDAYCITITILASTTAHKGVLFIISMHCSYVVCCFQCRSSLSLGDSDWLKNICSESDSKVVIDIVVVWICLLF